MNSIKHYFCLLVFLFLQTLAVSQVAGHEDSFIKMGV
ncbi:uncharacterized protein METZ01_LOCUS373707, partial [marine metagenome]